MCLCWSEPRGRSQLAASEPGLCLRSRRGGQVNPGLRAAGAAGPSLAAKASGPPSNPAAPHGALWGPRIPLQCSLTPRRRRQPGFSPFPRIHTAGGRSRAGPSAGSTGCARPQWVRHRLAAPRLRQHGQQKPRNGSGLTSVRWFQQEGAGGRGIKANDITHWHGSARRELFLAGPGPGCLGKRLQMLLRAPGAGLPAPPRGHPARGRVLRVLLDARIPLGVPGVPAWTLGCRVPARRGGCVGAPGWWPGPGGTSR